MGEQSNADLIRAARDHAYWIEEYRTPEQAAKHPPNPSVVLLRNLAGALEVAEKRQVVCGLSSAPTNPHEPSDVSACWGCYTDALKAATLWQQSSDNFERLYDLHINRVAEILGVKYTTEHSMEEFWDGVEAVLRARVPSAEAVEAVREIVRRAFDGHGNAAILVLVRTLRAHWFPAWGAWPGEGGEG